MYWSPSFLLLSETKQQGQSIILTEEIDCISLVTVIYKMTQSLLGGHLAALLNSGYSSVGGCDCTQHLQTGDAQSQALRRAGRTSATTATHAEV